VVVKPGAGVEAAELVAHARARLAAYKVPKYLVVVDSLPKNPSGKILKRDCGTAMPTWPPAPAERQPTKGGGQVSSAAGAPNRWQP
jgi:AMP-binding enzyme